MSKLVHLTINGQQIETSSEKTILQAAEEHGIYIPRLCYYEKIHEEGNCRVCSVKVNGQKNLKPACRTNVDEGMNVITDDLDVYNAVTMNLELLAHKHHFECFNCSREDNCEFLDLLQRYSVENELTHLYGYHDAPIYYSDSSGVMTIDSSKCILCGRCVSACQAFTGLGILNFNERGSETYVGPALFHNLEDAGCIYCGKCIQACPTGALSEKDDIRLVETALRDPRKTVVIQVAPSVRATLGEEFGYPIGTNVEGQMFAALKKLGVDEIMDTNFTADLTILEEGTELINRIKNNGPFPMFTSCSPGWVNYMELYHPDLIPNLSTCKSPQQMAGALIKTYYAKELNLDPKNIVSISIMPCIAKKAEARRHDMGREGYADVDIVLTTRELARLIKRRKIDFNHLEPIKPFGVLSSYTGAGTIFGATGGVMEAALRTVTEILENKPTQIDFKELRGTQDIKEATYHVAGLDLNVAVIHGGFAIGQFLEEMKKGQKKYHFIEIMGCTGGCINGGGQPIVPAYIAEKMDIRALRAKVLYDLDQATELRKSHENPFVISLYEKFLGHPNSHLAHKLLHTHYERREPYQNI
ncbi:MAG: 4Fe-4S dicluster domain-containing protein [Acholeplasma sp.]|jgi:NADP-reducing hydrogenase subunit HndD|nr:MAG: 4Fe-4S dicluster domain-containing protein [Acholeplasma sp.]